MYGELYEAKKSNEFWGKIGPKRGRSLTERLID